MTEMGEIQSPLVVADYLLVVGFFVVMLAIGIYFAGRMRDMKDYFAGSKQVPWWLASVSYWMSSFSAFAFVALSAIAYKNGFVAVTTWWIIAVMTIITGHLVAARWRRVATTSPMEFVEQRYGLLMRQGLSYLGGVLIVLDDATKIMAVGMVVSASLGLPTMGAILACGLIMLTYTLLGGLWAVLITDMVQFVVMMTTVIVLVPLALARVGGVAGFVQSLPEDAWALTGGKYTVAYLSVLSIIQFLNLSTRWSLVQRFYAVPRDTDARKVCYLAAVLFAVMAPVLLFPAVAASIYLPGEENPDRIYGLLCRELLPVGMLGMMVAAIFSATMSSLSSDYNAVASVLTTDVYKRLVVCSASDRHYVAAGRVFTLIVGLVTVGIALALAELTEGTLLFDLMVVIFTLLGPSTMIPVLAGLLSRRVSGGGALCGMATGVVVSLVARLFGLDFLHLIDPIAAGLTGHTIAIEEIPETAFMTISIASTTLGLIIGSVIWPGSRLTRERTHRFLRGLTAPETQPASSPASADTKVSPVPIVGTAIAALGGLLLVVVLASVPVERGICSLIVGAWMLVFGCGLIVLPRLMRRASA